MTDESTGVDIRVLDKDYRIACTPDERDDLVEAARLLDVRMREIRKTGRVIGSDRIAVLAGLNIAYELLQMQHAQGGGETVLSRRLSRLQARLNEALSAEPLRDAPLDVPPEKV